MQRQHTRFAALAVVGGLVAAGSVLGLAAPAQAHNYLVDSTPKSGSTLTELPDRFSVTTNDTLLDLAGDGGGFGMLIKGSDGLYYGDGCVTISDATLSTDAAIGAAGTYTLIWQLVSTDGHSVSDEYTFDWAPPAGGTASETTGSSAVPDCGGKNSGAAPAAEPATSADESGLYANLPWIGGAVVAILIAIGVTLFLVRPKKKQ